MSYFSLASPTRVAPCYSDSMAHRPCVGLCIYSWVLNRLWILNLGVQHKHCQASSQAALGLRRLQLPSWFRCPSGAELPLDWMTAGVLVFLFLIFCLVVFFSLCTNRQADRWTGRHTRPCGISPFGVQLTSGRNEKTRQAYWFPLHSYSTHLVLLNVKLKKCLTANQSPKWKSSI